MKDRQALIKKLDEVFSEFIRLRDTGSNGFCVCVSCGSIKPYGMIDCGHYIPRANMATRFDEMNCHGQCRTCNQVKSGNLEGYRRGLVYMFGEERVQRLEEKKYRTEKLEVYELEALLDHYKRKVKELRAMKPNVKSYVG